MDRQTITVDIAPGSGPIQRIRLSQGDIGRQLGVYIIQNGAAVDCSGYSAHLYVLKPDKNYYEKTCSISSNLISWETAEQETPLAGECKAQIRITSNGMDIGTANFIEAIEATPASGGTASESLISSMTQYVDAAETAARTAVEAEDTVEDIISTYSGIPGRVTNAENSLSAVEDGLAIVANGNTHAAIASGQFVYVRNHSTLVEGLYKATAAITTNGTLSTSNLTADSAGGLNDLQTQVTNLDGYLPSQWVGNITDISQLNSLTVPGKYLRYITNGVGGLSGGWAVVEVAALSGYDNYFQTVTFPDGNTFARNHPTSGEWTSFASLTSKTATKKVATGTTSFSALDGNSYASRALDRIHAQIDSLSSGIHQVESSGGPIYFVALGKYQNSYYGGYLFTYGIDDTTLSYRFAYQNGTYAIYVVGQ